MKSEIIQLGRHRNLATLVCDFCKTPHPMHGKNLFNLMREVDQVRFTCRYCGAVNWYKGTNLVQCVAWNCQADRDKAAPPPMMRPNRWLDAWKV